MADTNNDNNVEEDAKAKAAARRRRILEAGQSRMDVVSGNVSADTKDNSTPTKSSSSNRLAQMRRRRFKSSKAAASTSSTASTATTADGGKVDLTEGKADTKVEKNGKEETDAAVETKIDEDEDTRKYMGVAKMRRRRLAQQKAATSSSNTAKPTTSSAASSSNPPVSLVSGHSKVAAFMQLITIVLLFASGFDAGYHSRANRVQTDLYVPSWAGGVKKENLSTFDDHVAFQNLKEQQQAIYQEEAQEEMFAYSKDEDEFGGVEEKPFGAYTNADAKVVNIDPLFQIDLDALTAGYTGVFGMIVRSAIYFHRLNLYFLYQIPKGIFWDMPKRWLSAPPILFVLALVIRLFSKHVLNAQIPELEVILTNKYETSTDNNKMLETGAESSNAAKIADAIDPGKMTSMATNFVKNWLQTNFPSFYFIITALRDVRKDMYVILCGVLLGMIMKTTDPNDLLIPLTVQTMNTGAEL